MGKAIFVMERGGGCYIFGQGRFEKAIFLGKILGKAIFVGYILGSGGREGGKVGG